MDSLPVEVLHLVVSELAGQSGHESRQGVSDLISLRLCNKTLSAIASEHLFQEIVVHLNEDSNSKLEAVATNPNLRGKVRRLQIASKDFSGPLYKRRNFERWLKEKRTSTNDMSRYSYISRAYAEIPEDFELSSSAVEFFYDQYSSRHKRQSDFLVTAEKTLEYAIGRFPNLGQIISNFRDWDGADMDRPRSAERRTREEISRGIQDKLRSDWYDVDQAMTILRAVEKARSRTGAEVDVSNIFGDFDTMMYYLADPHDRQLVQQSVKQAKHLAIYIASFNLTEIRSLVASGKVADFLRTLPELQFLRCSNSMSYIFDHSLDDYEETPSVSEIFGNNHWQHLSDLSLEFFYTAGEQLDRLFEGLGATLRRLSLKDILLRDSSWRDIFETLRKGILRDIEVYHLSSRETIRRNAVYGRDNDEVLLFLEDYPKQPDKKRRRFQGFLKPSHPLHKFLVQGHAWVPETADVLFEEQRVDVWT